MSLGNWNQRREPRIGIMIHYDDSASDPGAKAWLTEDERCKLSYNDLVMDDGLIVPIAPEDARAWHAGICKPSLPTLKYQDANSAFYGMAIAASGKDRATAAQYAAVIKRCRERFAKHQWPLTDTWRVVSHASEAWPRGRKVDCEGPRRGDPVLDLERVRRALARSEGP